MCSNKKIIILLVFLNQISFGGNFQKNCMECHTKTEQMGMFLERYEEKYGDEKGVKKAIFEYLKNPKKENSIMPNGFLKRFGVKVKTTLDEKTLKDEVDEYYKRYTMRGRLK